jgi:hypothetical protein
MTEDERRTKRLLLHSVKKLDDAYEHYKHPEMKHVFTVDLADIACCILLIGETEHLNLEEEIYACFARKTKRQGKLRSVWNDGAL